MIFKLVKDEKLTDQLAIQKTGETKQQMLDNANYLLRRSENFSVLFDQDNKFFRAKDLAGNFVLHDGQPFDPLVWGNEFTETDG
jgi:putative alpha-1,2-mannosidase